MADRAAAELEGPRQMLSVDEVRQLLANVSPVERERLRKSRTSPIEVRFWANVLVAGSDECWKWTGRAHEDGYGVIYFNRKYWRASRLSWVLFGGNGPIPSGMVIMHTCDNPPCVNPAHLVLGTHLDNRRDCINKGRAVPPPCYIPNSRSHREFCPSGHPLSGENLYIERGTRCCRACSRARCAAYRAKKKAER